ncbi:uncharacterized protein G2W53_026197 [Senna tora]|uniref:Transposase-associated domain-containing protein n=1 Tax=Senna tora TaxID=362788 RepID=A0A834TGG7_9FABA|nr:uncharacterized protein G2W53_026197 [Senna tora]
MSRVSPEYEKGLNAFLDFAFPHTIVKGKIRCACSRCGIKRWHTKEVVYDHLICTQFPQGYTIWTFHGESLIGDASNTSNVAQDRITNIGEPPPETNSASIPDDVSKECNKYWKVDIIDEQEVVRDGRLKAKFCLNRDIDKHFVIKKLGK